MGCYIVDIQMAYVVNKFLRSLFLSLSDIGPVSTQHRQVAYFTLQTISNVVDVDDI